MNARAQIRQPVLEPKYAGWIRLVALLLALAVIFRAGVEYSRTQVAQAAHALETSNHGKVNTFTKCLLEGWEATGELTGDKRRWQVVR